MELGAFSISLTVKDIKASKAFYEKFGFSVFGGDITQNWLILKNGDATIDHDLQPWLGQQCPKSRHVYRCA